MISETTPQGIIDYNYNKVGDKTSVKSVNNSPVNYVYDSAGRLSSISQSIGQGLQVFTYGYDVLSRQVILQRPNNITTFFLYDGHGSTRGLTDSNGSLTDSFTYDSYGLLIERTGSTPNNYLYAGEQFDHDLNLYYNRVRYLEVNRGRFWSQDEFEGFKEEPLALHKYLYANADPINNIDPSGRLSSKAKLLIAISIAGILAAISVVTFKPLTPKLTPDESNKRVKFMERTVEKALEALVNGCAKQDLPDDPNIEAFTPEFAKIKDPKEVTAKWSVETSIHGSAKESSPLPNNHAYAVKYYDDPDRGKVISIVRVTQSLAHYLDALLFLSGYHVNSGNAAAINASLDCK
ncbi:MAG: RHS repeat-associated core domain-containing protein [Acidobacteria bacterium]|nr:RHS repeat-associated core domain-containing protein [Acidobacteriota bacterium]